MEIKLQCSLVCSVRMGGRTGDSAGPRGVCLLLLMSFIVLLVNVAPY